MYKFVANMSKGLKQPVNGVLLDITGVLYESGTTKAIDGSVDAIARLRNLGIPFRFVTNESQKPKSSLVQKLQSFGFSLKEEEVIAPAPIAAKLIKEENLRPFLLVHPEVLPEFDGCNQAKPNCVVVGDAAEHFTYDNMNEAFRLLKSLEKPVFLSMGKGKYYQEKGDLVLDLGAFTAGLEYACGIEATIVGKPSPSFFENALAEIGVKSGEAVMIGDDINSDVGGAQNHGMQGVLVRTGKYRPADENHDTVKPDGIFNNLAEFVNYLSSSGK